MRSHAKAPTAGSTQRQAPGLGRTRFAPTAVLAVAIASLLAFAATPASASLLRNHESSFGAFSGESPQALAVDQSNGDIYTFSSNSTVSRFSSSGTPKNFTAGPNAGTNTLTGIGSEGSGTNEIAIDNSGGPGEGTIYIADINNGVVKVFENDGTPLASLNGSSTPAGAFAAPCAVAVDQSNGDLYVGQLENRVWRYSPSGGAAEEADYSGGIETSILPCEIAVASGSLYANNYFEGPLNKYPTSAFALGTPPAPAPTAVDSKATAVATDPGNGDVYVDEGDKISVFSSTGATKYSFGSGDFGSASFGVAVRAGGNAYVSDPSAHEIDVYGATLEPGDRAGLFSFGSFSGEAPETITVDQSNGDIYAFSNNSTVSRYSSAGGAKNFTAGPNAGTNTLTGIGSEGSGTNEIAIDNSGGPGEGTIYIADINNGVVKAFENDGTPLASLNGSSTPAGAFAAPCAVAVDQANGDLYVGQLENRVWRYSPSGGAAEESDYSGGIETSILPCQVAVASGSLYALNYFEGPLNKYPTSALALGAPPSPGSTAVDSKATAVATDPSNGDVYVDEGNKISVFSSSGATKYSFGAGDFGSASFGVAVRAGGNAYVSDPSAHEIDVYGPFSAPPPIVETKAATNIKHVKATLHGHLDPNNSLPITGCEFELGTDTSYGEAPVPCTEGGSFNAPADVSAQLAGLTPGATYHFRLHVTTGSGGFDGDDQSFEAIPASTVPEVTTGKGSILTATSSELKGTVDPNANPLSDCHFEYVTDLALQATGFSDLSSGGSVPCDQAPGSIPADFEDHEVTATVSGLDPGQIYRFRLVAENANGPASGADALIPGPPLVETTGSTYRTATTARLDSRVGSHGAPTTYRFEYVTEAQFQASGFAGAASTPDTPFKVNEAQQLEVLGGSGNRFKLSFGGETTPELTKPVSAEQMQAALRALPSIGSPNVRVIAADERLFVSVYTIVFQGALADTDVDQLVVSPGTPPISQARVRTTVPGGGGDQIAFVSAAVGGLQPATTYHYRVLADNGTPGGPSVGAGMTLTTRASDAPLGHGHLAGPPGSDRAWEQVSVPDTGGNPVNNQVGGISDNGDRVIYTLEGGSPGSQVGSFNNQLMAERTAGGWQPRSIYPTRFQATANSWATPIALPDLSQTIAVNYDTSSSGPTDVWRLSPGAPAQLLFTAPADEFTFGVTAVSDDGSRIVARMLGSHDPDHPVTSPTSYNLYDIGSATPRLIDLLPNGSAPDCGTSGEAFGGSRAEHWISADGSRVFFLSEGSGFCFGSAQLYVRDLETETTTQISSGSGVKLLRSTADAAFFTTTTSLVPEDEGGMDVYRYDLADESLDCLTCFPGIVTDVDGEDSDRIAVSEDGSRLYFRSQHRLLPGAAGPGIYRVDVASGALAYVAPVNLGDAAGATSRLGNAIGVDGSVFVFRSAAPGLNAVNGPQNDLTAQYYRYDDDDRSLACVSCPADGRLPRGEVPEYLSAAGIQKSPNLTPLSSAGDFAFVTPTALVPADQDTAGQGLDPRAGSDVYEWRDGRLLLVTDGLTATQGIVPEVAGVTPSGRDIFFRQAAQLTPDAIDAYPRLYDARVGGGFEFPTPPPPCPLEACQGTPRGAPGEAPLASTDTSGAGNVLPHPARCRKGKVRRSGRCVAKHHRRKHAKRAQHRANHDRRASR